MSLSSIPRPLRETILVRDGGRCRYCHVRQFGQGAVFHINHITPRSRGGTTSPDNLVLQCPYCSLHKSNKVLGFDPDSGTELPLFHPLEQRWEDHFGLTDDGNCVGQTPTGRATVRALRMNDPIPRTARALQLKLGLQ